MQSKLTIKNNQRGLVAILLTMVMMILITMIVLTFSQIIRREQRQGLDRQLNSRAYYAAESAINVVNAALDAGVAPASLTKSTCSMSPLPAPLTVAPYAGAIPTAADLGVTCLIIDPLSYNLSFSSIGADTTQGAHLKAVTPPPIPGGGIRQIEVSWQAAGGGSTFSGGSSFPPLGGWIATTPVLRIDVISAAAILNFNSSLSEAYVYFLYPDSSGVTGTVYTSNADRKGSIVNAICNSANTPRACKATLTLDPPPGPPSPEYYMRIRPIYHNADVVVTPLTNSGNGIQLTDGQITIDATGRSTDVLKRISVRRPVNTASITPAYAIDSNLDICKKLSTLPGETTDSLCGLNP